MSKRPRDLQQDENPGKPIRANAIFDIVCVGLRRIATEDGAHVSTVKEEMIAFWQQLSEDEKREHSQRIVDAMGRLSLSLESLKQEMTIASIKHRT